MRTDRITEIRQILARQPLSLGERNLLLSAIAMSVMAVVIWVRLERLRRRVKVAGA